jgi:epoxyqueuosine reductase
LTIELRSPIPGELRNGIEDWLFGCDICQEVCPWNRKAPLGHDPDLGNRSDLAALDALEILELSLDEFRARFRHTALWRAGWAGLRRNAAMVLGNTGGEESLRGLERAAADPDAMVSEAARWALEHIHSRLADKGTDTCSAGIGCCVASETARVAGNGAEKVSDPNTGPDAMPLSGA